MRRAVSAQILLLLCSLALTLGALELGARFYLHRLAGEEEFLLYAALDDLGKRRLAMGRNPTERRYEAHRYLGYVPARSYSDEKNRHNALGFRGEEIEVPKPPGEFRIACLGGSTTYGRGVKEYALAYPQLLEAELGSRGHGSVRVINAGAEGYTSWESLLNLEFRVLDLEPDLVISYDGINDVHARLVWPSEAYRGDNSGRRATSALPQDVPGPFEHSALVRILLVRWGRIAPHSELARTLDPGADTYYAPEFWKQWRRGSYPQGIFREATAAEMFAANPPVYFQRNLRSMVAVARAHGAEAMLATYAFSPRRHHPTSASAEYIHAIGEMNEAMRAVARETGAHLFDFAAAFPDEPGYYVDGQHVNAKGSRLQARLFADYLVASGLLPPVGIAAADPVAVR